MDNIIKDLINLLNVEIQIIEDKELFLNDSKMYIDIYNQLFKYLDIDDCDELLSNHIYINILLKVLYKKEDAKEIDDDIYALAYNISNYKKIDYYEGDINFIDYYKKIKEIINMLKEECKVLIYKQELLIKDKVERDKIYEYYNRILFSLKNNIYINNNDIKNIQTLLKENNYNDIDIRLILENINLYNSQINKEDTINIDKTIELLKKDYKEYNINNFITLDKKEKLNNYIKSIFKELDSTENIKIFSYILDSLNYEDTNYILLSIMNKYIKLLNNCKNNLLDDDNYYDLDLKNVILLEYNDYKNKYSIVKKYYEKYIEEYYKEEKVDDVEVKEENQLYFALTSRNTYFQEDIKDISNHYYDTIKECLMLFKEKKLPEKYLEKFTSKNEKFKNYRKIKYDNIRIIYKKIENNKFLILGILEKQETWGKRAYDRIISRDKEGIYIDDIELNNQYYEDIINYICFHKRKGK